MSINYALRYPANSTPPDANYTYGSAKNSTAPGAKNGSPFEKDWINDIIGFQQESLVTTDIIPSGIPDKVGGSQILQAINEGRLLRSKTLAKAQARKDAFVGMTVLINRYDTAGGGSIWEYVTGATANGFDIVDHNTLPLQLKLIIYDRVKLSDLGAKSDGGDYTGAWQAAAARADLEKVPLDIESLKFEVTGGITLDVAKTKLMGRGAQITFNPGAAATLLTFANTEVDVNKRGLLAAANAVDGITFFGPGKAVADIRFAVINDSVDNSIWGVSLTNGGFFGFAKGIDTIAGAFMLSGFNFHGISNGYCFNIVSATNAGERNSFVNSTFTNNDIILTQSNPNASTMFISCSIDYTPRMMTITAGDVQIIGGHIESNLDTQNWFVVSGSNSSLRVQNAAIVLNNTAADLSFAPFFCDPTVTMGGIFINNCELWTNDTFTTDILVDGAGVSQVRNITYFEASKKPALSRFDTDVAYGDYEDANYVNDYILSGTVPPVRTTDKQFTGSHSLQFEMTGGTQSKAIVRRPIKPSGLVSGHLYYQTEVAAATAGFLVNVNYLDASDNIIESNERLNIATDVVTWTKLEFTPQSRAPAGTVSFELTVEVFGAAGPTTGKAWIDDLVISGS